MSNLENPEGPEQPDENPYRARILHDAANLITGDRQKDYGPPEENFQRIAEFWTTRLRRKLLPDEEITAREVAELMILLKVARMIQSPTEDSYKDAAGYAGIGAEISKNEQELAKSIQVKTTTTQEDRKLFEETLQEVRSKTKWQESTEGPGKGIYL
jgi:hypothetical protein